MERTPTACIFNIQRFSLDDGPGIRTTVFLKGCSMHCVWCHNPESIAPGRQRMLCSEGDETCHEVRVAGEYYSIQEIYEKVMADVSFYRQSMGGVTFSGGEPLLQREFLAGVLAACKAGGLHTAVDTAGNVPWFHFESILEHTDLFLYDLKIWDEEKHARFTGAGNRLIHENLQRLSDLGAAIWIRIPVIPGINDTEDEIGHLVDFAGHMRGVEQISLLRYHAMGNRKRKALGLSPDGIEETVTQEKMLSLKKLAADHSAIRVIL